MTYHIKQMLRTPLRRKSGSWSVCSMVAEPPELLCAFAAHYLELGAQEVHLFLDDPGQAGLEMLEAIKGVRLTLCTNAYWQKLAGGRPDGQVMRQLRNANHGYRQCPTDWFLFCDVDEFFVSNKPVIELLEALPASVLHCRTGMAERVFRSETPQAHLFDGAFRLPLKGRPGVLRAVYGDLAGMTTYGLTGHLLGKSFVRAGRSDLRMRVHFPVPMDRAEEARLRAAGTLTHGPTLEQGWLVHFDGMTPLHWMLKLLRFYLDYAPRRQAQDTRAFARRTLARARQLNAVYEAAGDPAALRRLRRLIELDAAARMHLGGAGGMLDMEVDPRGAVSRARPQEMQFDTQTFDARLQARHGALIDQYGLAI